MCAIKSVFQLTAKGLKNHKHLFSTMNRRTKKERVGLDDLVLLDNLKEKKIVENLKTRYERDIIYTNIGPVLIAVNPFQNIPALYTEARIREYRGKNYFELSPHVYSLADNAYRSMTSHHTNQSIIITGESGSGKTESSKIIMQYISAVSGKGSEVQRVKERMLASNPVLEAFGNAKTVNNNNSSRFGKYMVILFDQRGDPVGGNVTNYLLEKSRVVSPYPGERNFHIFYQLCNAMPEREKERFGIYSAENYHYLMQSQCYHVDGIDDAKEFQEMIAGMRNVGFSQDEIDSTFMLISTILWLGNITFTEDHSETSHVADRQTLDYVASLLQVSSEDLESALCSRKIQTGRGDTSEVFQKPNTMMDACNTRDTLAKALYSKMFDWIVNKVNQSIRMENHTGTHIGVLDIYGFEIFETNGFEQLCINFVNEKLQQIFIQLTLKSEQEEYISEGIPWTEIKYFNNKPCCDLIEGKPGVMSICDDSCKTSKSDQMFVNDLGNFCSGSRFISCGLKDFTVTHYAGTVNYSVTGFLDKNRDTLFDDLVELVQKSSLLFVKNHKWNDIVVQRGQKKRPPTVGQTFKKQVSTLMSALTACVPHYIRCIKPNQTKLPRDFDSSYTQNQVKYLGLLENVRVRSAGYASRMTFRDFVERYSILSPTVIDQRIRGDQQKVRHIFSEIAFQENQHYAMGCSKVFVREAASLFQLEDLLDRKLNNAAGSIQKIWKRYKQVRYFLRVRAKCYDLVNGRKERRRNSVSREYLGDYLNFSLNPVVKNLISLSQSNETILFADKVKYFYLKGKRSLFKMIADTLTGKPKELSATRFLMLSNESLYCFVFEADPETGNTRAKVYFRIDLSKLLCISLSPNQDNFVILHFTADAGSTDALISCKNKTEFVGLVSESFKIRTSRSLPLNFTSSDSISIQRKNKVDIISIQFVKDEFSTDETVIPHVNEIRIQIASGLQPSQVTEPFRPPETDENLSVREQVRAIYTFEGNGVDELSFREGDVLDVIDPEEDGWYRCQMKGKKGFVPANYVTPTSQAGRRRSVSLHLTSFHKQVQKQKAMQKRSSQMWHKILDEESGYHYFFNETTGASQWEAPSGFVE